VEEIDKRKIMIYDLLRKVNQASQQVKAWQAEMQRLDQEIVRLEQEDG
jgi:cell division protein FtsB